MVYGRLDVDNYCETDMSLLSNPVRVAVPIETMNFSISDGCRREEVIVYEDETQVQKLITTSCEFDDQLASLLCFQLIKTNLSSYEECTGTFRSKENKWYVCEVFQEMVPPGRSLSLSIPCHAAQNLGQVHDLWPKAILTRKVMSVLDAMGAVSINGIENRQVTRQVRRDVTRLHVIWFYLLTIKMFLLLFLSTASVCLRLNSVPRILNDDRALLRLLRHRLEDWIGFDKNDGQSIFLRLQRSEDGEDVVWASTIPDYNSSERSPDLEQ